METNDNLYCALLAAQLLISERKSWTQDYNARDREGRGIYSGNRNAICWCAWGAICAVQEDIFIRSLAIGCLERNTKTSLSLYNDTHPHKEVLALFNKAIKELENGN